MIAAHVAPVILLTGRPGIQLRWTTAIRHVVNTLGLKFGHKWLRVLAAAMGKPPYIVKHRRHLVGRDSIPAIRVAQ